MFASMPNPNFSVFDTMSRTFELWVRERIAEGKYLGWIMEESGAAVASAGLLILDWPPHPLDPAGSQRGYVFNIFVEPEFRRRGVAHQLLERCMAEARRRGIRVVTLHASDEGTHLYEGFGFHPTNEMMYAEPTP